MWSVSQYYAVLGYWPRCPLQPRAQRRRELNLANLQQMHLIRPVREPQRARRRVALRQWRRLADARAAVHLYRPIGDRARDARRDDFDHRNRLPRAPLYVLSSFLNVHFLELQQLLGMLVKKRFAFFRLVSSRALLNPTSKELQVCVC